MYGYDAYGSTAYGIPGIYAGSVSYTVTFDETETVTDSIQRNITRSLGIDIENLQDSIQRNVTRVFGVELVTLTETLFDYIQTRYVSFIETVTNTEVFLRSITKTNKDTASLTEVFTTIQNRFLTFLDSFLGLTDIFTKIHSMFATYSESLDLTDVFSRTLNRLRSFSETGTLTEVFSTIKGYYVTLTDSFNGVTDSIMKVIGACLYDATTINDTIRKYINGLLLNLWTKVAKSLASFTITEKPSTPTYTKELKPNLQDIWTPEEKPY